MRLKHELLQRTQTFPERTRNPMITVRTTGHAPEKQATNVKSRTPLQEVSERHEKFLFGHRYPKTTDVPHIQKRPGETAAVQRTRPRVGAAGAAARAESVPARPGRPSASSRPPGRPRRRVASARPWEERKPSRLLPGATADANTTCGGLV